MIKYNKKIYTYEALITGAKAFQKLCKISISDYGEYWKVNFENCIEDEQLTKKEFGNYIIEIINGAAIL